MTSIQHHVMAQNHSISNPLDNHLDALLDDLQTSVSRPGTSMALSQNGPLLNGSAFGGQINLPPGATGYREVTTTVTSDNNGVPMTSRDYHIEYLNPANSVTVLDEQSSSPALDLMKSGDLSGHQLKSYKTEVYDYKYSKTTTDRKTTGYGAPQVGGEETKAITMDTKSYYPSEPQQQDSAQYSRTENFKGKTNVSKNLNELDMLLKELNSPPSGGLGDSMDSSKREHIQSIEVERNPGRYNESPSTMPKRSASATRETTYSERTETRSNRAQSPAVSSITPKAPARTINVQREYNTMETRSHTSRKDGPSTPTLRRRTPSPSSGEFRPSNFSNYPISPKDLTPTRTVSTKTYNYSSTGRAPTPTTFADEPQPYRSPSPVSFPQKRSPSPIRKNLNRSDSGRSVSYQVSPPVSENPTVITYKYSSHSREQSRYPGGGYEERDQDETITRPFPTSTPIPVGEQSPPKKLDELMASFQDSKSRARKDYAQGSNEYRHHVEYSRESHERHGGELQRSPSFERNLRPSNVKVTQTYSNQQQQNQEYQNQHREQYQQSQYQQREQQSQYQQREQQSQYQQREQQSQYQQREQQSQYQQREQQSQYQQREQQSQYQQREHPGSYQREYQRKEEYQTREHPGQYQQNREQYQQSQYQQYHQNQGGYQQEQREQYQQNRGQYQQNQQYQYQQHQQYQQNSSQIPINESMSSSHAHRMTSASKSVAGPPVYYPPGVELFTKKEEAMLMEQSGGKDKSKGKSKSKDKSKDKGKKLSGVPVCLPVCCAMPCSIM